MAKIDNYCQSISSLPMEDPTMATMNVSLPDGMKAWVEAQSETGRYSNASDYVRDLIRRDQERKDKIAAMQTLIDEGLSSGTSSQSKDEIFQDALARVQARSDGA
ncbi:type II toxin-antitoxin system ParD family antitoxin [Parasedimentitalea maritima]